MGGRHLAGEGEGEDRPYQAASSAYPCLGDPFPSRVAYHPSRHPSSAADQGLACHTRARSCHHFLRSYCHRRPLDGDVVAVLCSFRPTDRLVDCGGTVLTNVHCCYWRKSSILVKSSRCCCCTSRRERRATRQSRFHTPSSSVCPWTNCCECSCCRHNSPFPTGSRIL